MASMMGLTKSRGCEVVKRTRRMPGIGADAVEQRGEVPAGGRGVAVAVDVLAEQLDFGIAGIGEASWLRPSRWRWCGCARVRG